MTDSDVKIFNCTAEKTAYSGVGGFL